jgi:hypothetical protein
MFLDYLSLVILLIGLTLVFYTFIYIHDLPYTIAKKRHHPQAEAIHVACWLSLFTLHAIWPIVYIWAVSHKKSADEPAATGPAGELAEVRARLARLEQTMKAAGLLEPESHGPTPTPVRS